MARKKKIDKEMGFRLKKARTDQKLTYEELAEKSGVSSRYIKEIENHGNMPSIEKLVQRCLNNSEKQCLIFVTGQGGGRRQCGGIVD